MDVLHGHAYHAILGWIFSHPRLKAEDPCHNMIYNGFIYYLFISNGNSSVGPKDHYDWFCGPGSLMCNKYGYHIIVNKINDMYKESIKCILYILL